MHQITAKFSKRKYRKKEVNMNKEEKSLLFKDLSARLPYHVKVKIWLKDGTTEEGFLDLEHNYADVLQDAFYYNKIKDIKPYLRPMSSMTEEETTQLSNIISEWYDKELFDLTEEPFLECALSKLNYSIDPQLFDWLNAHHFDYRGLIEKGLAIEATEGMYK
jgi:hypothetical protein